MDKRARLAEIFRNTQRFYTTKPALIATSDVSEKNTKLYDAFKEML